MSIPCAFQWVRFHFYASLSRHLATKCNKYLRWYPAKSKKKQLIFTVKHWKHQFLYPPGKRKHTFNSALSGDMLVPWRVPVILFSSVRGWMHTLLGYQIFSWHDLRFTLQQRSSSLWVCLQGCKWLSANQHVEVTLVWVVMMPQCHPWNTFDTILPFVSSNCSSVDFFCWTSLNSCATVVSSIPNNQQQHTSSTAVQLEGQPPRVS